MESMHKTKSMPSHGDIKDGQGDVFKVKAEIECLLYHNQGTPTEVSSVWAHVLEQKNVWEFLAYYLQGERFWIAQDNMGTAVSHVMSLEMKCHVKKKEKSPN